MKVSYGAERAVGAGGRTGERRGHDAREGFEPTATWARAARSRRVAGCIGSEPTTCLRGAAAHHGSLSTVREAHQRRAASDLHVAAWLGKARRWSPRSRRKLCKATRTKVHAQRPARAIARRPLRCIIYMARQRGTPRAKGGSFPTRRGQSEVPTATPGRCAKCIFAKSKCICQEGCFDSCHQGSNAPADDKTTMKSTLNRPDQPPALHPEAPAATSTPATSGPSIWERLVGWRDV